MQRAVYVVFLLLVALAGMAACRDEGEVFTTALPPEVSSAARIRGVTLDAREEPSLETLRHLRDLGVSHLILIPFGWQERHDTPEIRHNPGARWYSESDAGIRHLARQADSLGLHVVLKPHLWIRGSGSDGGPKAIRFDSEDEWRQWEADYRNFVMHYARLSEAIGAPFFCIGTELAGAARERPASWRALIHEVRAVYGGKLTYAANWYDEYEHITFWDALDYIGIQAYFPLSSTDDPSTDRLKRGWAPHYEALADLAHRVGKPVLFTEIGYRSVPYAAAEPWRWPSRDEVGGVAPDLELQARLYRAFFETVWAEPFFAGAVIWKWYPHDTAHSERRALDFTPQGKPAEQVIATWFRAAAMPAGQ